MTAERAGWREQQGPAPQAVVYPAHSASPGMTHRTLGPQTWFTGNGPKQVRLGNTVCVCVCVYTQMYLFTYLIIN